jgi:hypothetical protein
MRIIFGLAIETSLTPVPLETDEEIVQSARDLLEAAKAVRLVSAYERSARAGRAPDACVICLEETPPADVMLLPCTHQCVHEGCCVRETLRRCPLCRTNVAWTLGKAEDGRLVCTPVASPGEPILGRSPWWRERRAAALPARAPAGVASSEDDDD